MDWFRMPLTLKLPVTLPNPPGVASPLRPPSAAGGATTPGMSVPSCAKFRPLRGRSTTFFWSMTMPSVPLAVSTSGACSTMVMFSLRAPVCRARFTRAVSATVTRTLERVSVVKPARLALSS